MHDEMLHQRDIVRALPMADAALQPYMTEKEIQVHNIPILSATVNMIPRFSFLKADYI
jgi:hypothetical protein